MNYKLTNTNIILRTTDGASFADDPRNIDYQEYLAWLDEGNTPDPADPAPAPAPDLDAELATAIGAANTLGELKDALLGTNQNYRVGGKPK